MVVTLLGVLLTICTTFLIFETKHLLPERYSALEERVVSLEVEIESLLYKNRPLNDALSELRLNLTSRVSEAFHLQSRVAASDSRSTYSIVCNTSAPYHQNAIGIGDSWVFSLITSTLGDQSWLCSD